MYIKLIRNEPQGSAITGRLVINGRWFCNTLERVGYQIPALCYHVAVTMSPKFKRLLPIVRNVPQTPPNLPFRGEEIHTKDELPPLKEGQGRVRTGIRIHRGSKPEHSTGCILVVADNMTPPNLPFRGEEIHTKDELPPLKEGQGRVRTGIRIHRGSKPEHSTGCILVVADNMTPPILPYKGEEIIPSLEGRSGGSVENQLTQLLLKAQKEHEEIILEVTDFRPGTELGYNTPCERELQQHAVDARRAEQRYYEFHPEECK